MYLVLSNKCLEKQKITVTNNIKTGEILKMNKRYNFILILALLGMGTALYAQPSNDNCENAIVLGDISNWCSAQGEFTTVNATPSGINNGFCPGNENDVWFSFVTGGTDITVTVIGQAAVNQGGTLHNPSVYIFQGTCSSLDPLRCESDPVGNNITELYLGGLTVGQTYYLRVQGIGSTGTFQLCINNYNPPAEPESDCPDGATLCDKSPFVVQSVTGAGNDITEMNDAACFSNGIGTNYESNSTWFNWICDESGTLTFTLTPLNASDDLDFVLYHLPNGINDCSGKEVIRCMASGQQGNACVFPTCPCLGPTGLNLTDGDISEDAGCGDAGDDSWLSAINMVAGEAYTLVVNNFSSTGNGFSIEFGGTGTFRGPEAAFTTDEPDNKVCVGEDVSFIDASTFAAGSITGWNWTFGVDAVPATASGQGPHSVVYNSSGLKSVVLTIETDLGCVVTEIATFTVVPEMIFDTLYTPPDCGGIANGSIQLQPTQGEEPIRYNWGSGWTSTNHLDNAPEAHYIVTVMDNEGCTQSLDLFLEEPNPALNADVEQFIPPSCFGYSDGSLVISATDGTPPFQFSFDGGALSPDNTLSGIPAGDYNVYVIDAEDCDADLVVTVTEPPPLDISIDTVNISCFGEDDGAFTVQSVGGVGGYTYIWNPSGQTDSIATGLSEGQYFVTVHDANGCEIIGQGAIWEPPELFMDTTGTVDIICYGDSTGSVGIIAWGGRPGYAYSWDDINYQLDTNLTNLPAGIHTIYVRDTSDCKVSMEVELTQPAELIVDAGEDQLIDLGYTADIAAQVFPLGRPVDIEWTPANTILNDCHDCFDLTVFPFQTTTYTATITDSTHCQATDDVTISVYITRPVYIPNVFSPNNDGFNDGFTVYSNRAAKAIQLIRIFNRWGDKVFEGRNLPIGDEKTGWRGTFKGKKLDPDVFVYMVDILFIDGHVETYSGDVTLLR